MEHISRGELNSDFRTCMYHLHTYGLDANPRGQATKELINYNITLTNPRNRIVNFPARKTNLKYLLGEFCWYLSGSNDPAGIELYSKFWSSLTNSGDFAGYGKGTVNSNYGHRMFGADPQMNVPYLDKAMSPYGVDAETGELAITPREVVVPRSRSQWAAVVDILARDKDSRQAIINIHRPEDRHVGNKDVACTIALQFLIRENKLSMITTMRSNDLVLGFSVDVFQFTMLQEALMLQLREVYPDLELGTYYHNAGSMHVYERHFPMMHEIIADERALELPMVPMDRFDEEILELLVEVETGWRLDGMKKDFDFNLYTAYQKLTPYWQNLIQMCFVENEDAMHDVFGIHEH